MKLKYFLFCILFFSLCASGLQQDFRKISVGTVKDFTIIGIDENYLIVCFCLSSTGRSFFTESVRMVPEIRVGDSLYICYVNYQSAGICTQSGKIYNILKNTWR
jgi:hypothetical protein